MLRVGPYRFFFSNEGSEPAHIHVETGAGYAKYWPEPVWFERSSGLRPHQLVEIRRIVEENETTFVERWNESFGNP